MAQQNSEDAFIAWMEANGATLNGVRISRFSDCTGRGVAATRALREGEVVVRIPEAMVLTPESSSTAQPMREIGLGPEEFDSPRLEREGLVLAVMAEQALGTRSKWACYLAALPPPQELHCPILWSKDELALLQGSSLLKNLLTPEDDAQELPNMTDEHWEHVAVPFLEQNSSLGFGTTEAGKQAHRYASALVAGFSFSLGRERVQAMVPFWDMLNHANPGEEGVRLNYDADTHMLEMITTQAIKEGEQVFNTYGPIGNAELLRRYGFVTDPNPFDGTTIHVETDRLAAMALEISLPEHTGEGYHIMHALNLLSEAEILPEEGAEYEVPISGSPPTQLLEALRLLTMETKELARLGRTLTARGPRRRYQPLARLRSSFAMSDEQARKIRLMLGELVRDALQARRKSPGLVGSASSKSTTISDPRRRLAKAALESECRCLEALQTFSKGLDKEALQQELGSCHVWHNLALQRGRHLRDFMFSPYHKFAHTLLGRSPALAAMNCCNPDGTCSQGGLAH
mmetsp:Transcript_22188/g.61573  ORF Transcript_22188/g.61573 Transcript_22188/m.61573 type:complete len:516 (+) Transcript_22188:104-1651(+)